MSLYLARADSRLTDALAADGWLDDEGANQDMGYGSGEIGAQRAYESVVGALERQALFGVYRGEEPVALVILAKSPGGDVAQFHGLVAPKFRKTVLAGRVIQAIQAATFQNGVNRLETEVLVRNRAAVRLLKALGFVLEGNHPARHLMDGKRETTMTLRQLKKEWRR